MLSIDFWAFHAQAIGWPATIALTAIVVAAHPAMPPVDAPKRSADARRLN